jgi:hypothetical protein
MSEKSKSKFDFDKWIQERQEYTQKAKARAEAVSDVSFNVAIPRTKDVYAWLMDVYAKLDLIYKALKFIYDSNQNTSNLLKLLLGIEHDAKRKEIEDRAREFGENYELFMNKAKELESEQKEKERLR